MALVGSSHPGEDVLHGALQRSQIVWTCALFKARAVLELVWLRSRLLGVLVGAPLKLYNSILPTPTK
jgi:hypothetical protein